MAGAASGDAFLVWSIGSSVLWTGLAFWRMVTMNPANFIVLFVLGAFELMIAARVLVQPMVETESVSQGARRQPTNPHRPAAPGSLMRARSGRAPNRWQPGSNTRQWIFQKTISTNGRTGSRKPGRSQHRAETTAAGRARDSARPAFGRSRLWPGPFSMASCQAACSRPSQSAAAGRGRRPPTPAAESRPPPRPGPADRPGQSRAGRRPAGARADCRPGQTPAEAG